MKITKRIKNGEDYIIEIHSKDFEESELFMDILILFKTPYNCTSESKISKKKNYLHSSTFKMRLSDLKIIKKFIKDIK